MSSVAPRPRGQRLRHATATREEALLEAVFI